LPAQPEGTLVEFYVEASDDDGETSYDPPDAPYLDDYFSYFVTDAVAENIYQIQFTDAPDGDSPFMCREAEFTGVVTVDTTNFGYAAGSWRKFFLQDVSDPQGTGGAWNGVMIYTQDSDANWIENLNRGDEVTIHGSVSEYHGMTEVVDITDWQVLSSGNPGPSPVVLSCAEARAEAYEAVLVQVQDVTVVDPGEGYSWVVSDGSGELTVSHSCSYDFVPETGWTGTITGVMIYDYGEFKIMPRDDADLDFQDVETPAVAAGFALTGNYPNPFNPATTINYSVPSRWAGAEINLAVFDVTGRRAAVLVQENRPAGEHSVVWDASGQASGVYFCRLEARVAGEKVFTTQQKMLLLK
jgi:hypothetical protein